MSTGRDSPSIRDSSLWPRAREIFEEVVSVAAAARVPLLEARCGHDRRLRRTVEALLEHDLPSACFPARPAAGRRPHWLGTRLGSYRLLDVVGQGGGGVVFLAARDVGDFDQRVAVKIIRRALGEAGLSRFQQERQILAQLDHPHIARLLDGGVTADGYPYVVMEFVDGEAITDYCDRLRLPIEERLALFQQVCAAVAHAHRHLVIHRDLKPSNILVAEHQVKLLDFGIAKRLEDDREISQDDTTGCWMTPTYASPEQILGAPTSVASDVFSLGVLLYELLTGRSVPWLECARRPTSQPSAPSSVAVAFRDPGDEEAIERAARRSNTPGQLRRRLKGDLDHIVLRALRDEPQSRYSGADELGREIERHLSGLPVEARRGNNVYRFAKLLRRHPRSIAAALVLSLATLALAATAFRQSQRLAEERDAAERERIAVETVAEAMVDVIRQRQPLGGEAFKAATKRTLDRTTEQVADRFAERPVLHARFLAALGWVYHDLAFVEDADRLLSRSLEQHRELLGEAHPDTVEVLANLADLRQSEDRLEEAETLARQALGIRLGAGSGQGVAASLAQLGWILAERGEYADARLVLEEAVGIVEGEEGTDPLERAHHLNTLAVVVKRQGELDEARRRFSEALVIHRRESDPRSLAMGSVLNNLASLAATEGDFSSAVPFLRESLEIQRHHRGDDHPRVDLLVANLGSVLHQAEQYEEAEILCRDALRRARRRYGGDHATVATRLSNLGILLRDVGRPGEAKALLREALVLRRRHSGDHPDTASTLNNLGLVALEAGDLEGAEDYLRQAVAMQREVLAPEHWLVGNSMSNLAKVSLAAKRPCEAASRARSALEIYNRALPSGHWRQADARSVLGAALGRLGQRQAAEQHLRSSAETLRRERGDHSLITRDAQSRLRDYVDSVAVEPRSCPPSACGDRVQEVLSERCDR